MKNAAINLSIAAALGCALVAGGVLLDGPSDEEIAKAAAADLVDAKLAAKRLDRDWRACKRALGANAELIEIARSGDYVCRVPGEVTTKVAHVK